MTNTVLIKRSGTANSVPLAANLQSGELAINYTDGNLFYKNSSNVVTVIASNQFVSVSGNVTGGNILTGGLISATGNITSGNLVTGGLATVTGNITGGNLRTAGQISATGTVTSNGTTSGTGFAVGNGAVSNVGLGFFPNAGVAGDYAIRDYSTVTGSMYFDMGMGGTAAGAFQFRTTNAFTQLAVINSSGINTSLAVSATGNVTGGNVNATGSVYGVELWSTNSVGSEGGQINLSLPASGSTLSGGVIIDVFNNQLRFYERTGTNRGAYIDLTAASAGVGSNLLAGGGSTPTQIVNGTSNVVVASSGNVTVGVAGTAAVATFTTAGIVANSVSATNNGAGTNFQVGDDAWIGDVNNADTISIRGQQNAANGYIVFGNADSTTTLGRSGSGPLTYLGAFSASGNIISGNITTPGLISATGNITGNNLNAAGLSLSGNVVSALVSAANITTTANISGGNLIGTLVGNVIGTTVSVTGNVTGGNLNAAGLSLSSNVVSAINSTSNITTTANVAGNYFIGNGSQLTGIASGSSTKISNGTSEANIGTSGGNANISIGGVSNVAVFTTAGLNITGVMSASGNVTGGNLNAAGLSLSGNVLSVIQSTSNITTTGNVSGNYFLGNANVQYTASTSPPASGNLYGAQWYDTATDTLYEYQSDGTSLYWVDITGPVIGSTGAGGGVTIKEEGVNLTTAVQSIDFVGGGVTATNVGNAVTVTVPTGTTRAQAMTMSILFGG